MEYRADGPVACVEVHPGEIIKLPAWMLDPVACTGMGMGEPQASLSALVALHDLLVEHGLRRTFHGDLIVTEEERDEAIANTAEPIERAPTAEHTARCSEAARVEQGGTRRGGRRAGRVDSGSGGPLGGGE